MRRFFTVLVLGLGVVGAVGCGRAPARDKPVLYVSEGGTGSMRVDDDGKDGKKEEKGPEFKLPADAAGKLLEQVLPPTPRPGLLNSPTRRTPPAATPPRLATLEPTLPDVPAPRPTPLKERKDRSRPVVVTEEAVDDGFDAPAVPVVPSFETLRKDRERSESVHVPPPLPYLGTQIEDRVSFDDPTLDASTEAALIAPLPERTSAVPFTVLTVPEPFELRKPLDVKVPDERSSPQSGTPELPPKSATPMPKK